MSDQQARHRAHNIALNRVERLHAVNDTNARPVGGEQEHLRPERQVSMGRSEEQRADPFAQGRGAGLAERQDVIVVMPQMVGRSEERREWSCRLLPLPQGR